MNNNDLNKIFLKVCDIDNQVENCLSDLIDIYNSTDDFKVKKFIEAVVFNFGFHFRLNTNSNL